MAARIPVSGLLAINGKLYSPGGGSLDDPANSLRFKLSLTQSPSTNNPAIKLEVHATRYSSKEDNPAHIPEYEASLCFPANGIFNFSYTTPDNVSAIAAIFQIPTQKDVSALRYLNFAAEELYIINMSKVPRLRTTEMGIDIARLFNTAKSAILIPDAILDISFLIYGAYGTTDATMMAIETAIFGLAPVAELPAPVIQIPKDLTPGKPLKVLSMDTLMQMYKKKSLTKSDSGSSTASTLSSPLRPPFDPKNATWSSPFRVTASKSEGVPNKFQTNSPPKSLDPKGVCFNCYVIGHRENECTNPSRGPLGRAKASHKASKTVDFGVNGGVRKFVKKPGTTE